MIWLLLASSLATLVVTGYVVAASTANLLRIYGRQPADWLLSLKSEVRPFVPVLAAFNLLIDLTGNGSLLDDTMQVISCVVAFLVYATDKDDDDRWKRRRKKAAEKIQSLGHKLVVAPVQG